MKEMYVSPSWSWKNLNAFPKIEPGHMSALRTRYIQTAVNTSGMESKIAEPETAARSYGTKQFPGALFRSNQIASFDYAENRKTFVTKVRDCALRTFDQIGTSLKMQDLIFWNLSVTKKVGVDEVADKPAEFIEGMRAIFGEAGADVFEYLLVREIKRDFGFAGDARMGELTGLSEVLQLIGAGPRRP
jgi:hypothetical protein